MNRVSLYKCDNYEYKAVKDCIRKSFDAFGGIDRFVKAGEKVVIKPNLVMRKSPDSAATTHPSVVRAVAELVIEAGGKAIIAESPGGPFNEMMLKTVYKGCGMEEAAALSEAELSFNTNTEDIPFPDGVLLKRISVVSEIFNADKVINLCKLKTHGMVKMTCAVKNMFGTIPGTMKAEYHLNRSKIVDFANALIDICLLIKPVFTIVDAVECMEGNGPTGGNPRHVGLIAASDNPFILDVAMAGVINIAPNDIPVCAESIKRGLCSENLSEIEFIGGKISDFCVQGFVVPKTKPINVTEKMPKALYRFVNDILQPYPCFDAKKCVGCGRCAANCPPKALIMKEGHPYLDKKKCIRCFCCQELCPKIAVEIKRPVMYRIFSSL